MKHLLIEPKRLKIAVFDFTGCAGCSLQITNREETLADFLQALEVSRFREVSSEEREDYDIALIDGAISRGDEIERLRRIRKCATTLVALGSCACFGGVNKIKSRYDIDWANAEVYGSKPKETLPVQALHEIVPVDLEIPGCPVRKEEVERIVQHLMVDVPYQFPAYPVCVECKQRFNVCTFDIGQLCLGPITRAGCDAPCPANGLGCWGCRGPAVAPNYGEFLDILKGRDFSEAEIAERLGFFGGFEGILP